jgi:ABC-type Fe3+-hydroxamate transport system substrate-binding protein
MSHSSASRRPGVPESSTGSGHVEPRGFSPGESAGAAPALHLLHIALLLFAVSLVATVSAQSKPARIVSLIPAVTEMLFAMGAGDQVAGVSAFDTYPREVTTRPRAGGLFDPNFEAILTLRPDLVVVYGSQEELINRLGRASIPMFSYRHAGLADITTTMRAIGQRAGHGPAANALATQIENDLAALRKAAAGKPRPRTLLVFGREEASMRGLYVSGGIGFLHDMLELAGGTNVMADVKREGLQLSMEQLLSRAPDVVLELRVSERWSPERQAREESAWRAVSIPAVRNGRVRFLPDEALTIPGPRVANSVRLLGEAIRR